MKKYYEKVNSIYKISDLMTGGIIISFIIVFLDTFDIPSLMIKNNNIALIILFLFYTLVKISSKIKLKLLIAKNVNTIDRLTFNAVASFVLLFLYVIVFDYKKYKIVALIIIFIIQIIINVIRITFINTEEINDDTNVLDLENIFNNKVELNKKKLALLEEKDVNYDLLNRKDIINQLYNTIVNCIPKTNFTVGLNGPWGSGKTTIINNVIELMRKNSILNDYIIIKFDPWKYNEEKVMLQSFLKQILDEINYSYEKANDDLIQGVINTIFGNKIKGLGRIIANEINDIKGNVEIYKVVNNYLTSNNKKLLIIIDNMDRIDANKAFFLIKCVETIVKFNRTINILLYDEDILNEILQEKFHYRKKYMDKLVQLKIDIPETDKNTLNQLKEKVVQNVVINGKPFANYINDELYDFSNIRELKRYINSIIVSNCNSDLKLNKQDDSNLKYLKSVCPQLFYEIWNNKRYYVTYDRQYDTEIYTWDYKKLNSETKEYYNELFKNQKFKKYSNLLEKMFPTIKNYKNHQEPFPQSNNIEEYHKSIVECLICNARYFDLYFTREENDFIRLNNEVKELIKIINESKDFYEHFKEKILKYNADELRVFAEIFNININKISTNKCLTVIKTIINLEEKYKDRPLFLQLDSNQRFNIIVADLLSKITNEEFKKYKSFLKHDYKKLRNVSKVKYWVDNNKEKDITYNFDYDEIYKELCEDILTNRIDIYSPENYTKGNIWSLYHYDIDRTQEYIKNTVNKNNVYKFLGDIISVSIGTKKYGYRITKESINALAPNLDIDALILETDDKTDERKQLIKEVYEFYKLNNNKHENSIYKDKYIEL